jgi:hypothetical protein
MLAAVVCATLCGGGPDGWADMGRTGAAGIANFLSPYTDGDYRERALAHAKVIGKHPQSFPDTHGSPLMGMGYTAALAANIDADSFRKLLDANRWWFTMAHCWIPMAAKMTAGRAGRFRVGASNFAVRPASAGATRNGPVIMISNRNSL